LVNPMNKILMLIISINQQIKSLQRILLILKALQGSFIAQILMKLSQLMMQVLVDF
jgi:hypothetical protein